jgi:phosphatidylglycerol---prolipoprotein diacylglyceryl transferase
MDHPAFTASPILGFHSTAYGWLIAAAICVSLLLWLKLARRDARLVPIYFGALAGAFLGAKLVYLAAEGWLHWQDPHRWLILATGKSITGALLGGYAGVEIAKHLVGYPRPTGDWFAMVAPLSIMIGRVGCVLHGCCLGQPCDPGWFTVSDAAGQPRWPAAQVELIFNAIALGGVLLLRRWKLWPGQHFHFYLVAYGLFRFAHEFLRATPHILGPISGYQLAALAVALLGFVGFERRRRQCLHPAHLADQNEPTNPPGR